MSRTDDPRHDDGHSPETLAEKRLDRAIEGLRAETSSDSETSEALARIWSRIESAAAAPADSPCAEFRNRLEELRAGTLPDARARLLQAHASECLPCRRAWKEAGSARTAAKLGSSAAVPNGRPWMRWAAAAAVLVTVVGLGSLLKERLATPGHTAVGPATVAQLDGLLLSPGSAAAEGLAVGDVVPAGRWLRTGKGSRAVLELADGSRVEMNERSQLQVRENRGSSVVKLSRGDVIVEAARRKSRDLFVETEEMSVAVKGTIFTVEHGLKGSRVGVLEGTVQVEAGRGDSPMLEPGQQLSSRSGLADRALREQVAWSRKSEQYRSLLDELEAVKASLADRPFEHRLRHDTALLDAMPEGTVFYAGLPNNSKNLRRFVELVTERLEQSPELRDWWRQHADRQAALGQPTFDEMLDALERLSESLGDEVVVALVVPADPEAEPLPLIAARLDDEAELRRLVDAEIGDRVRAQGGTFPGVGDRATLEAADRAAGGFQLAAVDGLVLAGPSAPELLGVADRFRAGAGAFASGDFHRSLAAEYRRGTETLLAFDLEALVARGAEPRFGGLAGPVLKSAGLTGLQHFILRSDADEPGTALLSFKENRRGLASWLAEPAPMGSLEFVSARATVLFSAVLKDPEAMLRDMEQLASDESFGAALAAFREETGVDPFTDIAAPLGGEFTIALDGPLLPTPAWKFVVETYDEVRLQQTIERLAQRFNEWVAEQAGQVSESLSPVTLTSTQGPHGARHALRMDGWPTEVHYAFVDGYLVATSAAHRLDAALSDRELGATIVTAPAFTDSLPQDAGQHFSLVAWQNLGPALGLLMEGLGQAALPPGQQLPSGPVWETACLLHGRASQRQVAFSISSAGAGPGAQVAALLRRALAEGLQHAAEQGLLDATRGGLRYDDASSPSEPAVPVRSY